MRRFIAGLALAGLCACASVSTETKQALEAISPLEADPAGFAITLDLPPGLGVRDGSARFVIEATRPDTGDTLRETAILTRRGVQPGDNGRARETYAFRNADVDRLRAAQAQALAWKEETDGAASGKINLSLGGCLRGDGPAKGATASAALQIAADEPSIVLIDRMPVAGLLPKGGQADADAQC